MKKVLIIWEEIPEETKLFVLELEGKELEKALKAHGQLVNCSNTETDGADFLSEFLEDEIPVLSSSKIGKSKAFNVKELNLDYVVWSGFML